MLQGIQLDLFDDGISDVVLIVKKLKHHNQKLYKKCAKSNCNEMILDSPRHHYCFGHLIEFVYCNDILMGFKNAIKSKTRNEKTTSRILSQVGILSSY